MVQSFPEGMTAACLPSEAQWEFACRAGSKTDYYTGDGDEALAEAGWYSETWESGSTHAVGQKKSNRWGLFDMHGNVVEWCRDVWDAGAYRGRPEGVEDPECVGEGRRRVQRGGSWLRSAVPCRAAYRLRVEAGFRNWDRGFRVCLARSLVAPQQEKNR